MTTIAIELSVLEQALEAIQELEHASTAVADKKARDAKSKLRAALSAPMQLRQGECWPESIMAQWDYYRKLIASGDTSSAPRDWFEGLAETRLIAAPATAPDELERLRAESEERLQNAVALVAEVERLRAEVTRPESTDMTLMRTLVQSQATELEQLRKDAERIDYIEESGNFGVFRYRSGSKGPVLIEAEDGKKDINKSASTLRDAIDAVMKDAK